MRVALGGTGAIAKTAVTTMLVRHIADEDAAVADRVPAEANVILG